MNIYAPRGTVVEYLDTNGYDYEPIAARDNGFVKGNLYTVKSTDVGHSRTKVEFFEIKGSYNSVMFKDVKEVA